MDISRRSFLKLSLGGLLATAVTTNPVLSIISNAVSESPYKVFLYLIQTKEGKWKVKGTTCVNVDNVRIPATKFNVDTFKPLGVYSSEEVNDKKLKYWNQYNCGKGFQKRNYQISVKNGKKAKESGQWKSIASKGGKNGILAMRKHYGKDKLVEWCKMGGTYGKIQGKKNVESGHWKRCHELSKEACYIAVLQLDKKTNKILKEWKGAKIAANELNISYTAINNNLKGITSSSGGFVWKYKGDI